VQEQASVKEVQRLREAADLWRDKYDMAARELETALRMQDRMAEEMQYYRRVMAEHQPWHRKTYAELEDEYRNPRSEERHREVLDSMLSGSYRRQVPMDDGPDQEELEARKRELLGMLVPRPEILEVLHEQIRKDTELRDRVYQKMMVPGVYLTEDPLRKSK
jgi:hypothetical protein